MGRARRPRTYRAGIESLERRDNPSSSGVPVIGHAMPSRIMRRTDFHSPYTQTLFSREQNATQTAARISQAFQLFEQNALGIPPKINGLAQAGTGTGVPTTPQFRQLFDGPKVPLVNVPAGTVPYPATYQAFFGQLKAFTDSAVSTFVIRIFRVQPSVHNAPRFSPRALKILGTYADAQIAQAEQDFLANPPVFNPLTGQLENQAPKQAVEAAFNNILYAVGEYTVHPNLFTSPADFYVDPGFTFKIPYLSDPAQDIPNVYGRGPGGVVLPGGQVPPRLR